MFVLIFHYDKENGQGILGQFDPVHQSNVDFICFGPQALDLYKCCNISTSMVEWPIGVG